MRANERISGRLKSIIAMGLTRIAAALELLLVGVGISLSSQLRCDVGNPLSIYCRPIVCMVFTRREAFLSLSDMSHLATARVMTVSSVNLG